MEYNKGEVWGDDKVYCQWSITREKYGEMTKSTISGV